MGSGFTFSFALKEDALEINNLMVEVYNAMEDKSLYVCDDLAYVEDIIEKSGFVVMAKDSSGALSGIFMVKYPGMSEENLGWDIGLLKSELEMVAHMESSVVSLNHRGQGLQSKMLKVCEERALKDDKKYLMATVSPDNPASFLTLEKNGFECKLTKEKYGGLLRRIYLKTL